MAQTRINVPALYAALDAARRSRDLSWRQLAAEVGCSPSTMTRLGNGHRPDADAFMALTQWLRMPAERFWISEAEEERDDEQPELLAEVGALLRARRDLGEEERRHLQNVIEAAMRLHAAQRTDRSR